MVTNSGKRTQFENETPYSTGYKQSKVNNNITKSIQKPWKLDKRDEKKNDII